jgi:hypothetical protein
VCRLTAVAYPPTIFLPDLQFKSLSKGHETPSAHLGYARAAAKSQHNSTFEDVRDLKPAPLWPFRPPCLFSVNTNRANSYSAIRDSGRCWPGHRFLGRQKYLVEVEDLKVSASFFRIRIPREVADANDPRSH